MCDRSGLAWMPLAAQLFQALGDTGLRAGWSWSRLFIGISSSQEIDLVVGVGGRGGARWGVCVRACVCLFLSVPICPSQGEKKRCEGSDTGFLLVLGRLLVAESQAPNLERLIL